MAEMFGQNGFMTALVVGIAVVFLLVMVSRVSAKSKSAKADKDEGVTKAIEPEAESPSQAAESTNNPGVVAAITAAVNEYRKNNI